MASCLQSFLFDFTFYLVQGLKSEYQQNNLKGMVCTSLISQIISTVDTADFNGGKMSAEPLTVSRNTRAAAEASSFLFLGRRAIVIDKSDVKVGG